MSQMTDKEKIRKEVERLMVELVQEKKKGYSSDVDDACILELQNVLTYIDSLQEEKKPIREYVSPEDSTLGKLYKEAMEELEEKIALYKKNHSASVTYETEVGNGAIKALVTKELSPISENLEEAAKKAGQKYFPNEYNIWARPNYEAKKAECAFMEGAQWQKESLWKDAQGDDLPEIDREVIVLYQPYPCEGNEYAVSFAHRPPERWYGRNLDGEEHVFEPKTYDKGKWNIPNVIWWLDLDLPIKE